MTKCKRCGSYAINPGRHGRDEESHLDLCDVCYWRAEAEKWHKAFSVVAETVVKQSQLLKMFGWRGGGGEST